MSTVLETVVEVEVLVSVNGVLVARIPIKHRLTVGPTTTRRELVDELYQHVQQLQTPYAISRTDIETQLSDLVDQVIQKRDQMLEHLVNIFLRNF